MKNVWPARIATWGARTVNRLDTADIAIFRLLPSDVKRQLTRKFLRAWFRADDHLVELDGLVFQVPEMGYALLGIQEDNREIHEFLAAHLLEGMTFVDVGANFGYHTVLAARQVGQRGRVIALEPEDHYYALLQNNIALNGLTNVTALPYAAGSESRDGQLFVSQGWGDHSLYRTALMADMTSSQSTKVVALDEVIQGPVDVIKIDVEGAELDVLNGMPCLMRDNPRMKLVVEWNAHAQAAAGHPKDLLPRFLLEKGYKVSILGHNGKTIELAQDAYLALESLEQSQYHTLDLLATRHSG